MLEIIILMLYIYYMLEIIGTWLLVVLWIVCVVVACTSLLQ